MSISILKATKVAECDGRSKPKEMWLVFINKEDYASIIAKLTKADGQTSIDKYRVSVHHNIQI